jgi:hypothetical protein
VLCIWLHVVLLNLAEGNKPSLEPSYFARPASEDASVCCVRGIRITKCREVLQKCVIWQLIKQYCNWHLSHADAQLLLCFISCQITQLPVYRNVKPKVVHYQILGFDAWSRRWYWDCQCAAFPLKHAAVVELTKCT